MKPHILARVLFLSGVIATTPVALEVAYSASGSAPVLVTQDEARLPAYRGPRVGMAPGAKTRSINLGPRFVVIAPAASAGKLIAHRPVALHIQFQPAEGASIDVASLKVTYLRLWGIDITDRVRPYVNDHGIDIDNADIPKGDHSIEIEIRDTLGRAGKEVLKLTVL